MKVSDFDFHLPESLIALRPVTPRDNCRLLVLHRDGAIDHRRFFHLPEYLSEGDMLLLNNTKVFPARIIGRKKTGGRIEFLLTNEIEPGLWEVLCRQRYTGSIRIGRELAAEMLPGKVVRFEIIPPECDGQFGPETEVLNRRSRTGNSDLLETLWRVGLMPLPPYIKREPDHSDRLSYQTIYAEKVGSVAAPTAGLHLTEALIAELERKGVIIRFVTLHIGTGTFKPIRVKEVEEHNMDAESFDMDEALPDTISKVKKSGRRIVSVGTTTTRALEGFFSGAYKNYSIKGNFPCHGKESPHRGRIRGSTDIFIYPGYRFGLVDSLITNFHLPGSTPLMLTAALCGKENLLAAYSSAISKGYRFFSYGDAMLIL